MTGSCSANCANGVDGGASEQLDAMHCCDASGDGKTGGATRCLFDASTGRSDGRSFGHFGLSDATLVSKWLCRCFLNFDCLSYANDGDVHFYHHPLSSC